MNRRDSFKLILAAGIAPAFIAQGLMRIKPVVEVDWSRLNAQTIEMAAQKLKGNGIPGPYTCVIHPDMFKELQEANALIDMVSGETEILSGFDIIGDVKAWTKTTK